MKSGNRRVITSLVARGCRAGRRPLFYLLVLALLFLVQSIYAVTETTSLIRAGQTISAISRTSNVVTVTLSAAYPNNNLKPGQSIVIDTGSGGTASYEGTHTIASVASQTSFTYAQTAANNTGTVGAGSAAGGDYTTLIAWQAGLPNDLTAGAGSDTVEIAECYDD